MFNKDNFEDMETNMRAIDMLLEMIGGEDNSPIEMKIMYKDRIAMKLFHEIMESDEMSMKGKQEEIKQALLDMKCKEIEVLEEIQKRLK